MQPPNRRRVRTLLFVAAVLAGSFAGFTAAAQAVAPSETGVGKTARPHTATANVTALPDSFYIAQLNRKRRVWLYLPAGYAADSRRYPVLYLHDGQNCFDEATAFAGEWGVDETLSQLEAQGQDPSGCIVVAVENGGAQRLNEYSPWANPKAGGGQGDAYVDFLVHTLKPYVDAHYRTLPGREHTGIAGSSMGGLISVYAALKYQDVFGKAGVFSPSVWFAKPELLRYVRDTGRRQPVRFYLVAGHKEGREMVQGLALLRDALQAAGFAPAEISCHAPRDGRHNEGFWRREFPAAYRWLYGLPERPAAAEGPQKQPR